MYYIFVYDHCCYLKREKIYVIINKKKFCVQFQGVTLEDIQKAEEVLHSTDTKPSDKDTKPSDKTNNNVIPENDRTSNIEQPEPARRRYRTDVSAEYSSYLSTIYFNFLCYIHV